MGILESAVSAVCEILCAGGDYGVAEASTTYGIIGIKVWVFKGEIFPSNVQAPIGATTTPVDEPEKKVRKPRAKDATTV